MGADAGVVVSDEALAGSDVVATARVLAAAIARIGGAESGVGDVDLVVMGMASLDAMTSMLPGALAAALAVPALALSDSVSVEGNEVTATRSVGTVRETLAAPMPALVTVTDQANDPRYPNFAAIRAAKKKPLDMWDLQDLGLADGVSSGVQMVQAAERPAREAGQIVTDAGEAGRQLAAWLVENKLV